MFSATTLLFVSLIGSTFAHMDMVSPAPFRSKANGHAGVIDYSMTAPLAADGSNFPCKGYLADLGTASGASVATYEAGSQQQLVLDGGAPHGGGSMQLSLSYDNGKTFKVIKSFIGNGPRNNGGNAVDANQSYDFQVPADAASGDAIFSWSWFNEIGNREMYQNCAVVSITGKGTSKLDNLPDMFVANIGNGCSTTEGTDLEFPNPGDVVERSNASSGAKTAPPVGNCGASQAPAPVPTTASPSATQTLPAPVPTTTPTASTTVNVPAPSSTVVDPGCSQHVVVSGETCNTIGALHGVSASQIMTLNPAINTGCTNLMPGQILILRRRSRIMRNYY
jgi:LysM repeat protein